MEDKNILSLLDSEPEKGLDLLREQFGEMLRVTAMQRLGSADDVWECVQDTLTDFYMQRARFDCSRGSLRSYLITIADRKAIQRYWELRRRRLAEELSRREPETPEEREQRTLLRQAMHRLPRLDRQVLELRYFYGYTAREIAAALGMEHEAVKKRQQRAVKKLLRLMEE